MSKDSWANRDEEMRCGTCIYFMKKGSSRVGRCRRHAPTMQGYPVVFVDELGCGDHKLSEKAYEKKLSPIFKVPECLQHKYTDPACMPKMCTSADVPKGQGV